MAKKKDEHHGGAWKVAYADFVTAMMALFMVLWICAQKPEVLVMASLYFKDPTNYNRQTTIGMMEKELQAAQKDAIKDMKEPINEGFLRAIARDFYKLLNVKDEDKPPIEVNITSDGLKMTIYDRTKKRIFRENSTETTEWGTFVFQNLAWLVERHNFQVYLEGHTPKGIDLGPNKNYGSWELSADRANAIRRMMEHYAMAPEKVKRVTGWGDTVSLPNTPPNSEDNQRITVSLSLTQMPTPTPKSSPTPIAKQ
jgi:chemotaxis protein MotB